MSNTQLLNSPSEVFVGGDGAAREGISSDKIKQKSRFSLNSIIDHLPKFCKEEFCHADMDDTLSITSLDGSTENGLNSIHPDVLFEKKEVKVVKQKKPKKEKVISPTGMMQSRASKRRKDKSRRVQLKKL